MESIRRFVEESYNEHERFKVNESENKQKEIIDIKKRLQKELIDQVKDLDEQAYENIYRNLEELRKFDYWIRCLLDRFTFAEIDQWMTYMRSNDNFGIMGLNRLFDVITAIKALTIPIINAGQIPDTIAVANEYIVEEGMTDNPEYIFSETDITKLFSWAINNAPEKPDNCCIA